jgi:cysteine-rich repeat protein
MLEGDRMRAGTYTGTMGIVVLIFCLTQSVQGQVTTFNDSLSTITLSYPLQFLTQDYFIRIPMDSVVSEARMRLQGFDILGQAILPADVILVTDVSGSMGSPVTKINGAKAADISFLGNVNLNYIKVGLVHYSTWQTTSTVLDNHLTNNRNALISTINGYTANGYTYMGGGIQLAVEELLSSYSTAERKYILVMTDGIANCYPDNDNYAQGVHGNGACDDGAAGRARAANFVNYWANQAAVHDITIYGIGFGADAQGWLLYNISQVTGGQNYTAPDAAALLQIYNQIAQQISLQEFPTPAISTTAPVARAAWSYPNQFSLDGVWSGAACGFPLATCTDYRSLMQSNIDACASFPCDVGFSVYSPTIGQLTLSDLYIELNEPPLGNYPPIGNCLSVPLVCPVNQTSIDTDDGTLVNDPNDDRNTLNWRYTSSLLMPGGPSFNHNADINATRRIDINAVRTDLDYWEVLFFNVSDPWGFSTLSCLNASYARCSICGNSIVEGPEECDPGPNFDARCVECRLTYCGDHIVQAPNGRGIGGPLNDGVEQCDDGANGNASDSCLDDCRFTQVCGDGLVSGTEQCDAGTANNDTEPNACRTNCTLPVCGDLVIDNAFGEECDLGRNGDDSDYCSDLCLRTTVCGDMRVQGTEQCDDGNTNLNDTCVNCLNASCGDSFLLQGGEECDNGATNNSDTIANSCRANCSLPICGDRVADLAFGEDCDDGRNGNNLDGCGDGCERTPVCGDNVTEFPELCDQGNQNNDIIPNRCRTNCTLPVCGDSIVDTPSEVCDDGANHDDTDGCNDSCDYTTDCGNGILEGAEQCDLGILNNNVIADGCRSNCRLAYCSDGVVDSSEECDDGNSLNGDLCDAICQLENELIDCGNGIREPPEQCDEVSSRCNSRCQFTSCGDGVVQNPNGHDGAEECDDRNTDNDDFCMNDCTRGCLRDTRTTTVDLPFTTIDYFNEYPALRAMWSISPLTHIVEGSDNVDVTWPAACMNTCSIITPDSGFVGDDDVKVRLLKDGQEADICYTFTVRPVGAYGVTDPDETRLLVARTKEIRNYYEDPVAGTVSTWGPYTITIKVWEKR